MKYLNLSKISLIAIVTTLLFAQQPPPIRYGLYIQGTVEGEKEAGRYFCDLLPFSDLGFWELNKTYFRINVAQLLRLHEYKINNNSIEMSGSVSYRAGKNKIITISKFSKMIQVKLSPYGKIMTSGEDFFVEVINDGSIRNKISNHENASLILNIDSPIRTSFSIKQQPQFGTGD